MDRADGRMEDDAVAWAAGSGLVSAGLIARRDWGGHPLGDPDSWPVALRVLMATVLGAPDAMHIVWGPGRTFLFNDAYAALLGARAEGAMGAAFEDVWPDAWPSLRGPFERAMAGEAVRFVDQAVAAGTHGAVDDGWWTFSYTPARDERGMVRGIVCITADTTEHVRRREALSSVERRARNDLERSAAELRRAQRAGGIGVFSVDREQRVHGTEEFCRIFGLPDCDGIPAEEIERLVLPEDRSIASDAARRDDGTAAPEVEYRIRRAGDGDLRWVARRAEFEPDGREGGGRLVGVVQDVTERRAATAALVKSEAKFRAFTEAVPNQVWTARPEGSLDWANARVYAYSGNERRYGDAEGALPGDAWRRNVHPDDQAGVVAAWGRALSSGENYEVEFRLLRHDGAYRWHIGRAVALRGDDGAIVRWVGTNTDIDDQRAARDAIADQAAALERRVEVEVRERDRVWASTFDLMGTAGMDGVLRRINPAWHRQLGWPDATLLGGRFIEMIEPADHAATAAVVARLADGETVTGFTNRVRTREGGARTITWNAVPEGDLFHVVGRDTTEQVDAEDRLRQSQKMEAVGQLTGGLAHDFNNLLAGISGSLELIGIRLDQGRVADVAKYMTAAQGATRRAAALTHRLLAFSRRQTLDPRPTNVNALVAGMEELVQRTVGPGIHVEVVGSSGLWPVLVDPPQLENALLNLCINARDAMPDGGRITIETANKWLDHSAARKHDMPEGQYLSLCVTDTGTGMTPDVVAKAFDPFFTTKPIGEGTGLGLSMIYGFARQSGGQVRIYSEVGTGTTVCVYLPRHTGAAAIDEEGPAGRPEPPRAEQGETVLVVDDEPTIRMLVAEILEDLGYVAIEAGDSVAGLRILQSDVRVDLLITDVGLPGGMNGRQMADAARAHRRDLKVLFITGYAENALLGNGQLGPGMAVLTKPFAVEVLGSRIREMMSGR